MALDLLVGFVRRHPMRLMCSYKLKRRLTEKLRITAEDLAADLPPALAKSYETFIFIIILLILI